MSLTVFTKAFKISVVGVHIVIWVTFEGQIVSREFEFRVCHSRLVAIPRLDNQVCPTIFREGGELMDSYLSQKWRKDSCFSKS